MDYLEYKVDKVFDTKIRDYLKYEKSLSSRFIKKAAIERRILVNGKSVKLNYYLKDGDIIKIKIDRENETQNIDPVKVDFEVVYEDKFILVVNKPPYLVVYPSKSHDISLANGVIHYFKEKGEGSIVRTVNRLDMNTTGLLVIAKSQFSHMSLSNSMKDNGFSKRYLALVHGNLKDDSGVIEKNIFRPTEDSIKRVPHDREGQYARTLYKVKGRFNNYDLLDVKIETGRTHQIRVHMSYLNHPIVGDELYGSPDRSINRQLLHAYSISFPHPYTREILEFNVDMPEDMKEYIKRAK